MKHRLYINITNACNRNCPFCCMYSGSNNSIFMSFEKYAEILDLYDDIELLQIEGGEPVLHPQFKKFIEYALSLKKINAICVLTNGVAFSNTAIWLKSMSHEYNAPISVKVSFNYFLDSFPDHFETVKKMVEDVSSDDMFIIIGNVRYRPDDEDKELIDRIANDPVISKICENRIYPLQHYGLAKNEKDYNDIMIVCRDLDWHVFSCDGKDFGKDLVARSEYEGSISTRNLIK